MTFRKIFIFSTAIACLLTAILLSFSISLFVEKTFVQQTLRSTEEVLHVQPLLSNIENTGMEIKSRDELANLSGIPSIVHMDIYNMEGKLLRSGPQKMLSPYFSTDPDIHNAMKGDSSGHLVSRNELTKMGFQNPPKYAAKITIPLYSPAHMLIGVIVAYRDMADVFKDLSQLKWLIWLITIGIIGLYFLILLTGATRYSREVSSQSENIQKTAGQMEDSYRESLQILANAIEARAPHTMGHSERVSRYATEVAKRLSLSSGQVEKVRYTCLLQNLGLVRIPDAILLKNGKLGADEMAKLKRHPVDGAELIKRSPALNKLADAVKAHHERMDGTGYPDGLVGEQIPMEARIVAVADAYVAMSTDRPYRPALSKEQAISELRKHAGTQFDLKVVELMIQVIHELPERRSTQDRRVADWGPPDGIEKRHTPDRRKLD